MATRTTGAGILAETNSDKREEIIGLLTKAYWMEIETVMSYIANSVNPDGVRAQEIIESLRQDVQEELGHAQQFANRIKELYGVVPGSSEFQAEQSYLQPPEHQTDIVHVIRGVIEAETGAIEHYNRIIEETEGIDPVTNDMVIAILRDEEGHRRLFEGFLPGLEPGGGPGGGSGGGGGSIGVSRPGSGVGSTSGPGGSAGAGGSTGGGTSGASGEPGPPGGVPGSGSGTVEGSGATGVAGSAGCGTSRNVMRPIDSGPALEVGDLLGLALDLVLRGGELVLRLALALLLAALAAQARVVGQVAGGLLRPSCDLVDDAHVARLPQGRLADALTELDDRFEDARGARLLQLVVGESAGQHGDRRHAGLLGRLDVPRGVADHHGVVGAELLHRRDDE